MTAEEGRRQRGDASIGGEGAADRSVEEAEGRTAELTVAQEELGVTMEEIQQRNEKLRATRRELERERQRYQELFALAPDGYVVTDARGMIQEANQVASELLGVSAASLAGKPLVVYVAPEDKGAFYDLMERARREGREPRRVETELSVKPRGRERFPAVVSAVPVRDSAGETVGLRWMLRDVSERRRAEQELEEAERQYQELIRHAPAAIYEVDFREKCFTSVNNAMCRMLGYSREELLTMDPFEILDEEGQALFQARINQWLSGEEPDRSVEFRVKTKDGDRIDAVLDVTFTMDDQGQPLGAAVVAHDVTERKRKERRIQRYNRVLLGINRIFEQVIRAETEESLGGTCLAVAVEITRSQMGFVGEVGDDGLLHDIAISDTGWDQCAMKDQTGHRCPAGDFVLHGLYGRVIGDGASFFTNDPPSHPDSIGVPEGHPRLTSFLGVPLTHEGETMGLLGVANREGGYSPEQLEDLEALAPAVVEALLRKRAEAELRRERQLLETIYDTIPVMLTIYDPRMEEVWFNQHVERVTGWTTEDTVETHLMELVYPDPEYRQEIADYMQSLDPGFKDIRMTTKGGRTLETSWANVRIPDGRQVGIGIDITARKEAEEALLRSQERLAWVLDKTGVGTWLNELPFGRLNWDEQTRELFFVPPDVEPTIDLFWSRLHPEDREPTRLAVDEAIRNNTLYAIDHRAVNPETGKVRWIHSVGQATYAPDGTPTQFNGLNYDIAARKRAEKALRQYAERVRFLHEVDEAILGGHSREEVGRAVVERMPRLIPCQRAIVVLYDPQRGEFSLLAVHADGETKLGKGWGEPVGPDWEPVLERLERGQGYVIEDLRQLTVSSPLLAQLCAEGVRAQVSEPIITHGQLVGFLGIGTSEPGPLSAEQMEVVHELALTLAVGLEQARLYEEVQRYAGELERLVAKRTRALEASEARFRTIFEEAAIGIALVDPEGRPKAPNPALQHLLGCSEEELEDRCLFDLLGGADDDGRNLLRTIRQGRRGEYTEEMAYAREGGEMGHANVTVSRLEQNGGASLLLILMEDTTERKHAREMLIEAERLTAMGRMGASLAHEINNPLQSVIGCLGLAMEAQEEGEDTAELMDVALEELKRAANIVRRMRDISRPERSEKEPHSVSEVVEKVVTLTQKQAENHKVEVIWEGAEELPRVPMVRDRIQQVFLNLDLGFTSF